MPHENVELVTRAISATLERPRPDFETINALYHPDHVLRSVMTNKLGQAEIKGAKGYKEWMEGDENVMTWDGEVEGAVDIGPDKVLAVTATRFHGASSGADTEQRLWMIVTVVNGKITHTEAFLDPREALAAGLSE